MGGAAIPWLEVGGAPDRGVHLSAPGIKRKGRRRGVGPAGRAGWAAAGWKRRPAAWELRGLKKERGKGIGPAGKKGREGKERFFSFSFKFLFKFVFQTFKLQSNRNPCIRIMMHIHLLFLDYFSDV
jgi:hypothetical protein